MQILTHTRSFMRIFKVIYQVKKISLILLVSITFVHIFSILHFCVFKRLLENFVIWIFQKYNPQKYNHNRKWKFNLKFSPNPALNPTAENALSKHYLLLVTQWQVLERSKRLTYRFFYSSISNIYIYIFHALILVTNCFQVDFHSSAASGVE